MARMQVVRSRLVSRASVLRASDHVQPRAEWSWTSSEAGLVTATVKS